MRRFEEEWELLVEARGWLSDRGYRLIDSRGPEGMDQGFDVYVGKVIGIRIVADRSQWFVEVRPSAEAGDAFGYRDWFDLECWSTCLGSETLFHDPGKAVRAERNPYEAMANSWWLRPQLDYLRAHLGDIERACLPDVVEHTRSCLLDARRRNAPFPPRRDRRKLSNETVL
jgi:hypothetical protein